MPATEHEKKQKKNSFKDEDETSNASDCDFKFISFSSQINKYCVLEYVLLLFCCDPSNFSKFNLVIYCSLYLMDATQRLFNVLLLC